MKHPAHSGCSKEEAADWEGSSVQPEGGAKSSSPSPRLKEERGPRLDFPLRPCPRLILPRSLLPRYLHPLLAPGPSIQQSALCPQAALGTGPSSRPPSLPPASPRQKGAEVMREAPLSTTIKRSQSCSAEEQTRRGVVGGRTAGWRGGAGVHRQWLPSEPHPPR